MRQHKPNYNILELAKKWQEGTISNEEKLYYEEWYNSFDDSELKLSRPSELSQEELSDRIYASLKKQIDGTAERSVTRKLYYRIAAAASILLCLGLGGNWLLKHPSSDMPSAVVQDIQPGTNKAFLTLSNGKKITLTDVANGELFQQQGIQIVKKQDGQVIFQVSGKNISDKFRSVPNRIETPKGGQYQIQLPDGTKVWLNAASTLTFPSTFVHAAQRKVELVGEAYFEVKKNSNLPFLIQTSTQLVEVLGTHFNINSYRDEQVVKTTLLTGSVKISSRNHEYKPVVIKPGQEAVSVARSIEVGPANIEADMAWKNGLFIFKNSDLSTVMRQLSRWYDIEVEFKGPVPPEEFNGKVYRNMTLNEVLEVLSFSKVKFKIEGKKMTII